MKSNVLPKWLMRDQQQVFRPLCSWAWSPGAGWKEAGSHSGWVLSDCLCVESDHTVNIQRAELVVKKLVNRDWQSASVKQRFLHEWCCVCSWKSSSRLGDFAGSVRYRMQKVIEAGPLALRPPPSKLTPNPIKTLIGEGQNVQTHPHKDASCAVTLHYGHYGSNDIAPRGPIWL